MTTLFSLQITGFHKNIASPQGVYDVDWDGTVPLVHLFSIGLQGRGVNKSERCQK